MSAQIPHDIAHEDGSRPSAATGPRHRIAARFRDLADGAEELLQSTADYAGEEIESARARLAAQLAAAREAVEEWEHSDAARRYERWSAAADRCAREHPWTAMGVAAGVGLVAGCCLGGPDRRS